MLTEPVYPVAPCNSSHSMSVLDPSPPSAQPPEEQIRAEQLRLLVERDQAAMRVALLGIAVVLLSQWKSGAWIVLAAFALLRALAMWSNHLVSLKVRLQSPINALQQGGLARIETGMLGAGLSWGLSSWALPDPIGSDVAAHFLLLVLIGVTSVMTSSTAVTKRALLGFVLGLWGMMSIRMVWFLDPYARLLLAGGLVYALISIVHGLQLHRQIRAGIIAMLSDARRRELMLQMQQQLDLQQEELTQTKRMLNEALAKAEALNTNDELTGTLNRRAFFDRVATQLSALRRHDEASALVMIDIDHLKSINDLHGHEVGDLLLRRVASALQATLRGADLLARWGGDKFLIFMPRTDAQEACAAAERLRQALIRVAINSLRELRDTRPLSACMGLAEMQPNITLEAAIARAERGLYAAKSVGPGRTMLSGTNQTLTEVLPPATTRSG
ncbi:MAG: hypothetical protein RJA44_257 [Pseudomonadota bacterium]